jgi:carbamoyltransferase
VACHCNHYIKLTKPTHIVGISAYYHDSAAALIRDGVVVAAAQEERFTRKKHDPAFPSQALEYCLSEGGVSMADVDAIAFYDKPLVTFERLLETYLSFAPRGYRQFLAAMPVWLKDKLFLRQAIEKRLSADAGVEVKSLPPLLFGEHHESHAASAFFPSPFENAAVLCLDGVGEWATCSVWRGEGNSLTPLWEMRFPHSIGLLYSAFTYYCGFKVNSGEYKLMGLAPYGEPRFVDVILENLLDLKDDGTFRLNLDYFDYATGLRMTNRRFDALFGGPPRPPESEVTQREMDLARSCQAVVEEIILKLGRTVHSETGLDHLCLAGGVALNCVANGELLRRGPFKDLWIQPAAGDAGGAIGSALSVWHSYLEKPRSVGPGDQMFGAYLGPAFSNEDASKRLAALGAVFSEVADESLMAELAEALDGEQVVGFFNGRMEFGPRALGARSIIGDPRSTSMQRTMNLKIKYRESFRPFAPAVTAERVSDWFDHDRDSPYMLLVAQVHPDKQIADPGGTELFGIERLNVPRSEIPAVTHVDGSARVQTVHRETNPRFHALLTAFEARTGCPVLVNTSFNVRGEPIVCTPEDAYRCFMSTEMDVLVVENLLMKKSDQPVANQSKPTFELD